MGEALFFSKIDYLRKKEVIFLLIDSKKNDVIDFKQAKEKKANR